MKSNSVNRVNINHTDSVSLFKFNYGEVAIMPVVDFVGDHYRAESTLRGHRGCSFQASKASA